MAKRVLSGAAEKRPPGGRSIRETKPISAKPAPQRSRDLKRLQPLHSRTVQPRSNCHQTATAAGRGTSGGVYLRDFTRAGDRGRTGDVQLGKLSAHASKTWDRC